MRENVWKSGFFWVGIFFLLLFLVIGCSSKADKKARHLKRARQYIEQEKLKEAVIELKNVIQIDPEDDSALYELGEIHVRLKQGKEAVRSFAMAAAINPDNLEAHLKMGQIFLLANETEEARKKAELILEKSPENTDALALLSGVQAQEGDLESAEHTLRKALTIAPGNLISHLSLARLFVLKGDLDGAEKRYMKALSIDPESRDGYAELADIYEKKGEWEKAETTLKKMNMSSGLKYQNLQLLARFYERRGKWGAAEKNLLASVNSAPPDDVQPLMNLAAYYARRKAYTKVLDTTRKIEAASKGNLNVLVSVAQLHFDFEHWKEAEATVDKVLEKDKGHVAANIVKGRLLLRREDFDNALACFEMVTREKPLDPMAYYFKALSLMGQGKQKLAKQNLLKAVELNPNLVDARLMLAQSYLREGYKDLARPEIAHVLSVFPRDLRAIMLKGELSILEEDEKGAASAFRQAIEIRPNYAPAYVRLGLLYSLTKRPTEAVESLKKALALNPKQSDALALLVEIYLKESAYDTALKICEAHEQKVGDDPSVLAQLEYLKGRIHLQRSDMKKAKAHFENAIKHDPNILGAYESLAKIYVKDGRLSEAGAYYETLVSKHPEYLAGFMALGALHEEEGEGEKAETYYRKALEAKRDSGWAANNLAWNLAQRGGNIDEALSFAQIAKEQLPKNPAVMDTLGWIYYLKGSYGNALAELKDTVEQLPDNPVVNYHLGLAYYKNNEPEMARNCLEKALKIDPNFKGAEEALSVLQTLKGNG